MRGKLKNLLPLILIAIIVLTLVPLITAPPLKVGAIAGTVIDSDTGLPIEGATVTADGYSATTEADGTYLLADLPVGDYTVEASAAGYESASASATVEHKETTTVDFALVPIPPPPATVSVDPSSLTGVLPVGATFDVDIVVTEATDLYGFEFMLSYDTRVLTATAIDFAGNIFGPVEITDYFVWKQEINDAFTLVKGRVWCAVTQELGAPSGVSGSGLLATITFTVDDLGSSDLDLYNVELGDPDAMLTTAAVIDGDFANTAPVLWTKIKTRNPYADWTMGSVDELETLNAPVKNTGDRGVLVTAQFIMRNDATGRVESMWSAEMWIEPGTQITLSTDPFTIDLAGTYHFSVVLWLRMIDDLPPEPYYLYEDLLGGHGIAKPTINRIKVTA